MKWHYKVSCKPVEMPSYSLHQTKSSSSRLKWWIILFVLITLLLTLIGVPYLGQLKSSSSSFVEWSDCTGAGRGAEIFEFRLTPNPLIVPGNVSIGFNVALNRKLMSPTHVNIRLQKKFWFVWTDIPCINAFGSCSYRDLCEMWPIPGPECPIDYIAHGIPCSCPFTIGDYELPSTFLGHIKQDVLPSWLESGQYYVEANLWDNSDPKTALNFLCLSTYLNVVKK